MNTPHLRRASPPVATALRVLLGLAALAAPLACSEQSPAPPADSAPLRDSSDARAPDLSPPDLAPARSCTTLFRVSPGPQVTAAAVVGEWDWSTSIPLIGPDSSGGFERRKALPAGLHAYRFELTYRDGTVKQILDPQNAYRRYAEGKECSALRVPDCNLPLIETTAFERTGSGSESLLSARFRLLAGLAASPVEEVEASLVHAFAVRKLAAPEFKREGNTVAVELRALPLGKYTLRIEARDRAGGQAEPLLFPFWVEQQPYDPRDSPIYMVMVDRFRDGNPTNNPAPNAALSSGGSFQGGDLAGIRDAIDRGYFDGLGIKTLWLSPLNRNSERTYGSPNHQVSGYHGYWPIRAREIDPRFGTEKELEALVTAAHRHGIRILLDWVINHAHIDHEYVAAHPDWFRQGCVCGTPNCGWTEMRLSCLFAPHMPDLNWEHPDAGEQNIADALWWLERFDLDGLRVDAVKHVEDAAIHNLSLQVAHRFEAGGTRYFLLGETAMGWGGDDVRNSEEDYATISRYIGPSGLDGQFDFVLYHAVAYRAFAYGEEGMIHVDYWTQQSLAHYPANAIMTPYIGSHDTSRFLSQASYRGQDSAHPRSVAGNAWADSIGGLALAPADKLPYQRLMLALTWLYTIPGAPLLYYGDEYGEYGGSDPDNRHMFRPDLSRSAFEREVFAFSSELGQLRRTLEPLRRGTYRWISTDESVSVYARLSQTGVVLIALNGSTAAQTRTITIPEDLGLQQDAPLHQFLLASSPSAQLEGGKLSIELPPLGSTIFAPL